MDNDISVSSCSHRVKQCLSYFAAAVKETEGVKDENDSGEKKQDAMIKREYEIVKEW